MTRSHSLLKARLLSPFVKRYRDRLRIAQAGAAFRLISSDIIITNDRKLVYVKNSKSGCSTVAHALYYYNYGKHFDGQIHQPEANLMQGMKFALEGVSALRDNKTYKFTFVRNPTSRILSIFSNFVLEQTNRSSAEHIGRLSGFGYASSNTAHDNFDALLNYIDRSFSISKSYTDKHFRPQVINIAYGSVAYSYIGQIESYSAHLQQIFQESCVWHAGLTEVTKIKANSSKSAPYVPTGAQLKRIEALYYDDYVAFGYPLPSAEIATDQLQ